jgi:hypothetical protein
LEGTNKTIYLIRDLYPLNTIETIYIALPENAELEVGFERFIITSVRLALNSGSNVVYCGFISTLNIIKLIYRQHKIAITPLYEIIKEINDLLELSKNVRSDDMIIMINSRPKSVSHDIKYEQILDNIANKFPDINLAIVYPEQNLVLSGESFTKYDIMDSSPIQENIVRLSELAKIIKHKFIDKIKSKRS